MEAKQLVPVDIEKLEYETPLGEGVQPIDEIIASLVNLKNNGATHLKLTANADRDGDVYDIYLTGINYREETHEEQAQRIKHEEEMAQWRKNNPNAGKEFMNLISSLRSPFTEDGKLFYSWPYNS